MPSMTDTILILGGTGKTGARVAKLVREAGATARTAARTGADVRFDWADPASHDTALAGVHALYLVPPAFRLDHAAEVLAFADRAVTAGVRAITYLSAHGVEHAPPATALRAIELGLLKRDDVALTILRPAWFMQNFSEGFAQSGIANDGVIALPAGNGTEAFVHAEDIAAVATAALLDPATHAGQAYAITGPEALTHAEVAATVAAAAGRPVVYTDVAAEEWTAGATAAGLPADYARMLAGLLMLIKDDHGARPTDTVQRVTGRPPTDLATFAKRAAVAGAWDHPTRPGA